MPPMIAHTLTGKKSAGVTQVITSTTAPSTATALPTNANGSAPSHVRVIASAPVHVRFGIGSACTVTTSDAIFGPTQDYVTTRGLSTFEAMLDTTNPATSILNIFPIEF